MIIILPLISIVILALAANWFWAPYVVVFDSTIDKPIVIKDKFHFNPFKPYRGDGRRKIYFGFYRKALLNATAALKEVDKLKQS